MHAAQARHPDDLEALVIGDEKRESIDILSKHRYAPSSLVGTEGLSALRCKQQSVRTREPDAEKGSG